VVGGAWIRRVFGVVAACSDQCRDEKAWLRMRVESLENSLLSAKLGRPLPNIVRTPPPIPIPIGGGGGGDRRPGGDRGLDGLSAKGAETLAGLAQSDNRNIREFGAFLETHYVSHDPDPRATLSESDDTVFRLNVYHGDGEGGLQAPAPAGSFTDDDEKEIQAALDRIGKVAGI
jgi:hypothetical protein